MQLQSALTSSKAWIFLNNTCTTLEYSTRIISTWALWYDSFHTLQEKMTKNVERELLNHSRLMHPHIVRFHECFLTDKHLAIVMEYAAGGTLYRHVTAK
jgi:serine/threonine protein kinase